MPESPQIRSEELAHLYYTSGTTGKPKGVMLTHGNVGCHALSAVAELTLSDADTWIHAAPLFHLADAWATFAITWVGGRHICTPYFDAAEVLGLLEKEKVTISNMIPTMLNLMVNHPQVGEHDYSSLRAILSGGAPIAPETVRRIVDTFGCEYIQTYGMTETSPYLTVSILKDHLTKLSPEEQLVIKSRTGRPFIGVELKVVRDDGTEVAKDDKEVGEIIVRGPIVTPGYWNRPDATTETIVDGWLHTGDLAVIDGEGYVNIVDRKKDVIITGGENVYSVEVEYVLYEHPGVLECAVIGVPDEKWGEAIKAVVVLRQGQQPTEQEIDRLCKGSPGPLQGAQDRGFCQTPCPRPAAARYTKEASRKNIGPAAANAWAENRDYSPRKLGGDRLRPWSGAYLATFLGKGAWGKTFFVKKGFPPQKKNLFCFNAPRPSWRPSPRPR